MDYSKQGDDESGLQRTERSAKLNERSMTMNSTEVIALSSNSKQVTLEKSLTDIISQHALGPVHGLLSIPGSFKAQQR